MAAHHHIPEGGVSSTLTLIITAIVSIWTGIEMEIKHGVITYMFAIATCVSVFFLQRYLKKRFK